MLFKKIAFNMIRSGFFGVIKLDFLERFNEFLKLKKMIKENKINCFIDVGANKGFYSHHLRLIGYKGYIFSFEPNQIDCQFISELAKNDPKWKVFNFGLGDENTKKLFHVINSEKETTLSSFLEPICHKKTNSNYVKVKRLDSMKKELFLGNHDPIIFLKTDTQGFDLNVVKGAEGIIENIRCLQSEISVFHLYKNTPHYTKVLEFYESLGFSLCDLLVVNRTKDGTILEYDCLMKK